MIFFTTEDHELVQEGWKHKGDSEVFPNFKMSPLFQNTFIYHHMYYDKFANNSENPYKCLFLLKFDALDESKSDE